MTPAERALLDALTERARAGDAEALAALFGQLHPLLVRIAHREIGRSHARLDADDLASDVMLRLIERFRAGEGPSDNPVAYLARAIRNRVIDLRRAPASREVGADDFTALADAYVRIEDADEHRSIDVGDELALVADAMGRLPRRQRELLTAIAVEGAKPREVAAITGESANTVAAAASRARRALRIEIRRTMLEAQGADACAAHRAALAAEGEPAGTAREHRDECERCRRALARFAALPALGILAPLVVLTQLVRGAAAAQATAGGAGAEVALAGGGGPPARPPRRAPTPRLAVAGGLGLLALVGIALAFLLAPHAGPPSPPPTATTPSATPTEPRDEASATATPSPSADGPGASPAGSGQANPVSLAIDVEVGSRATTIDVALELADGATVDGVRVDLPASMRIVDAGAWRCETGSGGGACRPPTPTADRLVLVVAATPADEEVVGDATVEVLVVADGASVAASSTGSIRVAP